MNSSNCDNTDTVIQNINKNIYLINKISAFEEKSEKNSDILNKRKDNNSEFTDELNAESSNQKKYDKVYIKNKETEKRVIQGDFTLFRSNSEREQDFAKLPDSNLLNGHDGSSNGQDDEDAYKNCFNFNGDNEYKAECKPTGSINSTSEKIDSKVENDEDAYKNCFNFNGDNEYKAECKPTGSINSTSEKIDSKVENNVKNIEDNLENNSHTTNDSTFTERFFTQHLVTEVNDNKDVRNDGNINDEVIRGEVAKTNVSPSAESNISLPLDSSEEALNLYLEESIVEDHNLDEIDEEYEKKLLEEPLIDNLNHNTDPKVSAKVIDKPYEATSKENSEISSASNSESVINAKENIESVPQIVCKNNQSNLKTHEKQSDCTEKVISDAEISKKQYFLTAEKDLNSKTKINCDTQFQSNTKPDLASEKLPQTIASVFENSSKDIAVAKNLSQQSSNSNHMNQSKLISSSISACSNKITFTSNTSSETKNWQKTSQSNVLCEERKIAQKGDRENIINGNSNNSKNACDKEIVKILETPREVHIEKISGSSSIGLSLPEKSKLNELSSKTFSDSNHSISIKVSKFKGKRKSISPTSTGTNQSLSPTQQSSSKSLKYVTNEKWSSSEHDSSKEMTTATVSKKIDHIEPITFTEAFKSVDMGQDLAMPMPPSATQANEGSFALESNNSANFVNLQPSPCKNSKSVQNVEKESQPFLKTDDGSKNNKRSLLEGENNLSKPNLKKIRIFEEKKPDESNILTKGITKEDSQAVENRKLSSVVQNETINVLKKIKREELENIILELFVEKVLYEHQLGEQKDLCRRLETTNETLRKKTAQFHKELEDFKKVTDRLHTEHMARKSQLIAPVKVKRSVGIQVTPQIILKATKNSTFTNTLNKSKPDSAKPANSNTQPSTIARKSTSTVQVVRTQTGYNVQNTSTSVLNARTPPATGNKLTNVSRSISTTTANLSKSPIQANKTVKVNRVTRVATPQKSNSGIIDLTDDDADATAVPKPTTNLVALPRSVTQTTNQYVAINSPHSSGQVLLVPTSLGQSATLVVGNVASPNRANIASSGNVILTTATGVTNAVKIAIPTTTQRVTSANVTTPAVGAVLKHPAPLPKTGPQTSLAFYKKLPPAPVLRLSNGENSIVLSWNMERTLEHEKIASYQLYAYQESTAPPQPNLWKKVGSVKALELPMACTLTQFMPGHMYHFAVRAIDIRSRLGPFSDPRSIMLRRNN